ncbi:MAG: hypothetical protein CW342_15100 [Thermoactinomycetaceae bacterium]|nr:hypothetical protein [Thermoactinomycetaceae bacterium]
MHFPPHFFLKAISTPNGTCDVSSHFRKMIQFGNYASPEKIRRSLREIKEKGRKSKGNRKLM